MAWKKYLIRVAKYVMYFDFIAFCLFEAMHLLSGNAFTTAPDFSTFFTPRLLVGLAVLALLYPLLGFKSESVQLPEGGWEKHGQPLYEAMSQCRLRFKRNDEGKLVFGAESPMRRMLTVYEDEVTLELKDDNTLTISGLRKDVVHVRLRVGDYLRRIS